MITLPTPLFPAWIMALARTGQVICDVCLIGAAMLASRGAPMSVAAVLGPWEWMFVCLLALAGLLGLAGTMTDALGLRLACCCLAIGGLVAWVASLVAARELTTGQGTVMFVLVAVIGLMIYRIAVTCASIYLQAQRATAARGVAGHDGEHGEAGQHEGGERA